MFQLANECEALNREGRRLALLVSVAVMMLAFTFSVLPGARGSVSHRGALPRAVTAMPTHSRAQRAQAPLPCGRGWHYEFIGLGAATAGRPAQCASRPRVAYI